MSKLLCVLLVTSLSSVGWAQTEKTKSNVSRSSKAVAASAEVSEKSNLKIKAIEVSGNRKIEKDAILSKLVSKVGETYSAQSIREDVETLFKMGFFNDIEVRRQVTGSEVVINYKFLEKPSVTEILYEGNDEVKSEDKIGRAHV